MSRELTIQDPGGLPVITHYIKKYPDRLKLIQYKVPYSNAVANSKVKRSARSWIKTEDEEFDSIEQSVSRAKTKISDIVLCNQFDAFVTFTFNCRACVPKCINKPCTCDKSTCKRYDLDYCIRTQKAWYNNQIKKYGRFPYIQVMELHKDKGYHFHALFKNYKGPLAYWKTDKKDGRPIYRLASNKKGYTTVKEIYDISGTSSYIKKYITKNMPTFPGKKRFWPSQGLKRPIVTQDPVLMQQILDNSAAITYFPEDIPTPRKSGTLKESTSNLLSITTLMMDNEKSYLDELDMQKLVKNVRKIFGGVPYVEE